MVNRIIVYHQLAEEELNSSIDFYEDRQKGLGFDFLASVEKKIKLIEADPLRYPKRHGAYRETLLKRFPYIIAYRFNKAKNIITISAIHHASRNQKSKYRK
jgi:plasmid stabilization system protein ParE